MKAPLIIDAHGDTAIYDSVTDAEMDLEAIDVENNEYVVYDSEGRLLRLIPVPPHSVSIMDGESNPSHMDQLRTVLSSFLQRVGVPADWVGQASLSQMVEKALEYKVDLSQRPLDGVRAFFSRLINKLK